MNPIESETGDGQSASVEASSIRGWIRLILFLVVLGSATYAVSLAMTVPARLMASRANLPPEIIDVSGTLWKGQAILEGGYDVEWEVQFVRSLLSLSLDLDWTLSGTDSRLSGYASMWPNSATLNAEGRAGWGLVRLAAPDLPISCDGTISVSLQRIVIRRDVLGAVGILESGPAVCAGPAAAASAPIEVPPLTGVASMSAGASRLAVIETAKPETPLIDVGVEARVLKLTIHPEGARLARSLPTSGPITLEYPF